MNPMAVFMTVGVAMVALTEGRPQRIQANNQQLFQASVSPGYQGDASLAKIIEEQRFNLGNGGKFGHAAKQEDGVIIMEESSAGNNRIGQYSYIGDDGKTYTVKYEAGVNGFRILEGAHVPSGGQHSADAIVDENAEPYEYDYEYYDDVPAGTSPFVNPYDPTHQTQHLLAGNLAGHLAGARDAATASEARRNQGLRSLGNQGLRPVDPLTLKLTPTTPAPLRFFPQGNLKLDRFSDGYNFNFRSNKK